MGIGISYHMWFLFIPAFECIFCFDQLKIRSYLRAETRIQRILWIICTPAIFFPQWCLQIKVLYKFLICEKWNPSIYNILHWVAWTMVQTNRRPRVWCSKYYFFFIISCKNLCRNHFNLFCYFFITV